VLLEGESGVGKEIVASAIHAGSRVATKRMVALNCGAIPRELIASELFGHRRGAFSGAVETRRGAFDSADGGTLFLDEVGELPMDLQPALLRALELGEVRSVGQDEPHRVDVRVIAATNRDLEEEVAAGRFRQDLYYRLAVVRVQVPPLRTRPEDIVLLAEHFAQQEGLSALPAVVMEELKARRWPGNARELRNAIQAYAALGQLPNASGGRPTPSLEEMLAASIDPTEPYAQQKEALLDVFTRVYLRAILAHTRGNQAAASRIGGLDRSYVSRLMSKYGLTVKKVV
jgi:anaerobic nitric oxide reductase transcription regulator